MGILNITVLSNKQEYCGGFTQAVQTFANCRSASTSEKWEEIQIVDGVISKLPLDQQTTHLCLRRLKDRSGDRRIPIIFIVPNCDNENLLLARKLGATACFSFLSDPIQVVSALFRQISPDKTLTDFLVEYSVARSSALFTSMFQAGRIGVIERVAIESGGDHILSALREGGLRRWIDLVQAHDDMTIRHCLLVAGLVANFAIHLGLSTIDRTMLVRAGLVHDVGKAQIPLKILNKPGPLDAQEMAVMRTHAALGHDILLASGMSEPLVLAATRHHHEMIDGSGYPDSLCGDQIGDAVRLLTVCDIYAALTECRPYREALPQDEALQILRGMTPHRLERAIVEAFAASLGNDKIALLDALPSPTRATPLTRHNAV